MHKEAPPIVGQNFTPIFVERAGSERGNFVTVPRSQHLAALQPHDFGEASSPPTAYISVGSAPQ
jgi:hypothetical protein